MRMKSAETHSSAAASEFLRSTTPRRINFCMASRRETLKRNASTGLSSILAQPQFYLSHFKQHTENHTPFPRSMIGWTHEEGACSACFLTRRGHARTWLPDPLDGLNWLPPSESAASINGVLETRNSCSRVQFTQRG